MILTSEKGTKDSPHKKAELPYIACSKVGQAT
jgi:hypothetical protein